MNLASKIDWGYFLHEQCLNDIKTTGVKIVTINTKHISNGSITNVDIVDIFNECTDAPTKPFHSGLRVL